MKFFEKNENNQEHENRKEIVKCIDAIEALSTYEWVPLGIKEREFYNMAEEILSYTPSGVKVVVISADIYAVRNEVEEVKKIEDHEIWGLEEIQYYAKKGKYKKNSRNIN